SAVAAAAAASATMDRIRASSRIGLGVGGMRGGSLIGSPAPGHAANPEFSRGGAPARRVQGAAMPRPPAPTPPASAPEPGAAAECFAGMGLVRRALEAAGRRVGRTVFANDHDPAKQRLYSASFPDADRVFRPGDIGALTAADIPPADLWTAS